MRFAPCVRSPRTTVFFFSLNQIIVISKNKKEVPEMKDKSQGKELPGKGNKSRDAWAKSLIYI